MTDVTGFGLIGHSREMALASKVSLRLSASRVPALEGALDCIRQGNIPGGLKANREFAECLVGYDEGISEELKMLVFDPQTAGGLLISVASEHAKELSQALELAGVRVNEIGEVLPSAKPVIWLIA
jgi:selenide, water dikinase